MNVDQGVALKACNLKICYWEFAKNMFKFIHTPLTEIEFSRRKGFNKIHTYFITYITLICQCILFKTNCFVELIEL